MKILVGMSGGVDSSVAALLLKQRGYDVIGATLRLCQPESEIEDAKKVADKLGIPHHVFDFREAFEAEVVDYFANEYISARTPNPCNICNSKIKWELMLNEADKLGADYIATGHYAKIVKAGENGSQFTLLKTESGKDQTYALCLLTSEQLSRTLMPLGDYTKDEVRQIAKEAGLPTASKSDSMDICFIPDGDYAKFLTDKKGVKVAEGNFVDTSGNILGRHKGIIYYTVGQRRGLGISADRSYYVLRIDPDNNEVVLGYEEETKNVRLTCSNINWIIKPTKKEIACKVKIRYNHQGEQAKVTVDEADNESGKGFATVTFESPVKSITPGQMAVFYEDGHLLGGGFID